MVPLILIPVALALIIGALFGFRRFDKMLDRIYRSDRERWLKLGGPTGYFWHPNENLPFFRSTYARDVLFFGFMTAGFKDPDQSSAKPPPPR
jgi:hypothetical protein